MSMKTLNDLPFFLEVAIAHSRAESDRQGVNMSAFASKC